jgi:cyclic beta-1,2-glucan synthetase
LKICGEWPCGLRGRCDRDQASDWAEQMIRTVEQKPTDLVLVLADMARQNPPLTGAFLAELTRHLQGQNPNFFFRQQLAGTASE